MGVYQKIQTVAATSSHPGRLARPLRARRFFCAGPYGRPSVPSCTRRCGRAHAVSCTATPVGRFPPSITATILYQLFLALDFLHTECHLIHTDIKADHLLLNLSARDPVLAEFGQAELEDPVTLQEGRWRSLYLQVALSRHARLVGLHGPVRFRVYILYRATTKTPGTCSRMPTGRPR